MQSLSNAASSNRRLLLLLAVAAFLWTALRSWGYLIDDTFITLRFARNLVEGNGLVFNPGRAGRGLHESRAGPDLRAAARAARRSGARALRSSPGRWRRGALLLTARLERELVGADPARPALSALLLLAASAFAYWSLRAMETLLFTALLLAAISLSLREARTRRWLGSGCVFALLALTRPEGLPLFVVFSAALAIAERARRGDWSGFPRHLMNALVVLGTVAIQLAWRWRYYGELLPNTFYAKVTGGAGQLATGVRYLGEFALAFPLFAASLGFPLALLARPVRAASRSRRSRSRSTRRCSRTSPTSSSWAPTSCRTSGSSCRCCRCARC